MNKIRKIKLVRLSDAKRRTLGFQGPYQETLAISQVNPPA